MVSTHAGLQRFQAAGNRLMVWRRLPRKTTSSREIYDMYAITAAHKTLPLGTYVRVTNLNNGKTLDVRINDRGPFVDGRIIDLSYAAAKKLDIIGPGTADVRVIALGNRTRQDTRFGKKIDEYTPVNFYQGNFTIQVGAFENKENAEKLRDRLSKKFKNAHMSTCSATRTGKRSTGCWSARTRPLTKPKNTQKS